MANSVAEKIEEIGKAFEAFKEKNDAALVELKAKGSTDVVLKEQVDKISTAMSELTAEKNALVTEIEGLKTLNRSGDEGDSADVKAHSKAFYDGFVRKGFDDGLEDLSLKAMSVGVAADGGYAVPEQLDRTILDLMVEDGSMRGLANVISIGGADYKKLVNLHGAASGWVGETTARTATAAPTFAELTPFMGEIYANPEATQRMLDDAFFDVEAFLAGELAQEFASQEAASFIDGNGTNKPKGFLSYTQAETVDGVRAFGEIQKRDTGVAGGFKTTSATVNPADDFLDTIYSMKSKLRGGASWLLNSLSVAEVRKFKDNDGAYIWQMGMKEGEPDRILGYASHTDDNMPDIANLAAPIAFGNWKRAYTIVDRMGTRTLRDPFTNKPYVGFYTTKRVGGMVTDSEAIKIILTQI